MLAIKQVSMYLLPKYSLKAASASRYVAVLSKQLWENYWDWDTCSLFGQPAVMLDVIFQNVCCCCCLAAEKLWKIPRRVVQFGSNTSIIGDVIAAARVPFILKIDTYFFYCKLKSILCVCGMVVHFVWKYIPKNSFFLHWNDKRIWFVRLFSCDAIFSKNMVGNQKYRT